MRINIIFVRNGFIFKGVENNDNDYRINLYHFVVVTAHGVQYVLSIARVNLSL
jgi:hypothetical protein